MNLLDWIYPKRCVGCKKEGKYICPECSKSIMRQEGSLQYRGVVRKILKEIKYRGSYDMTHEIVELWNPSCPDNEAILTAVPMWEGKRRARGFNQAELIGRELSKRWKLEYVELLRRTRETVPMYGLKRWERAENMQGAFEVSDQCTVQSVHDSHRAVILVDDVWTSGATMRECEHELKQVGVDKVYCLTLAR